MFEIIRRASLIMMWVVLVANLVMLVRNSKTSKRLQKALATANGIIFKEIRERGKHFVYSETDNLCDLCQNGGDGCRVAPRSKCVRFLPIEGTNLTSFKGTVETPPDVDYDMVSDLFVNWVESNGWRACTIFGPYEDKTDPS